jgi:NADH-quinone oxidoreductase subunit K
LPIGDEMLFFILHSPFHIFLCAFVPLWRRGRSMNPLSAYIILGAILFALGLVGFLSRRNLIVMFLSTEVMFQGVIVNLVAFGRHHQHLQGQAFALFLLVIAAVEAGLALGLVVMLYRRRHTLDAEAWAAMSG